MPKSSWMLVWFWIVTVPSGGALFWALLRRRITKVEGAVCVAIYVILFLILFSMYVGQVTREAHAAMRQ